MGTNWPGGSYKTEDGTAVWRAMVAGTSLPTTISVTAADVAAANDNMAAFEAAAERAWREWNPDPPDGGAKVVARANYGKLQFKLTTTQEIIHQAYFPYMDPLEDWLYRAKSKSPIVAELRRKRYIDLDAIYAMRPHWWRSAPT